MKLNQIPEVMLEKKEEDCNQPDFVSNNRDALYGYNSALTVQGEVEVEIDLAETMDSLRKAMIYDPKKRMYEINDFNLPLLVTALSDNLPKILRRKT